MQTLIDALRSIVGEADFYRNLSGTNYTWDYGAMIEYFCAVLILLVVVSSIFRIIGRMFR